MAVAPQAAPRGPGRNGASPHPDALVIGAGPAGLASAATLLAAGLDCAVIERSDRVGQSWRDRHDHLRLNSVRWMSGLPGYPIERALGRWVGRDDYVAYLERYALRFGVPVMGDTAVHRIDREGSGWALDTSAGPLRASLVVVATGWDNVPTAMDWPGAARFAGELVHASDYREASPFRGAEVLIAGIGSSGAEIAVDLVEGGARRVSIAVRTPPNVYPRQWLGLPTSAAALLEKVLPGRGRIPPSVGDAFGRLAQRAMNGPRRSYRLAPSPYGVTTTQRERARTPVIVDGLIDALRDGRIELRGELLRFEGDEVVLADGARAHPDAVIAATGYHHGLEPIVGHLGVLDPTGAPLVRGPETRPDAPGLHFIGYRLPHLYEIARDARAIAKIAPTELAHARTPTPQGSPSGTGAPAVNRGARSGGWRRRHARRRRQPASGNAIADRTRRDPT